MNPTYRTRRLSVTVAAVAAAALALPACQGAATAASHRPHHHAAHSAVQPTQNGLTATDLKDLANMKRDLFQRLAQQNARRPDSHRPERPRRGQAGRHPR